MNTEPFLASTLVPWTVNGPTALPHKEALAAALDSASPSGMISTTTSSGASTSAAPRAKPRQPGRQLNRQPGRQRGRQRSRAEPAGITDPFHVATGKLPPVSMAAGTRAPVPQSGDGAGYGLVAP